MSILVRARNGGARLRMVLSALLLQRGPAWECLILDSGTTDGSLREVPRGMRVLPLGQPFTHPSSSNAAARAAAAPVLVFLSQDALPLNQFWLARLLDPLEDPGVAASFSRQVPVPGSPVLESRDLRRAYPESGDSPVVLSNAASALRRELWQRHPFLESLPLAEDLEWGRWARAQGFQVRYAPDSLVEHSHGYDPPTLRRRYELEGAALQALGLEIPGSNGPIAAWLRGLPGDLMAVVRSRRWAELAGAWSYHRDMFEALQQGAARHATSGARA